LGGGKFLTLEGVLRSANLEGDRNSEPRAKRVEEIKTEKRQED
jgi:hypothetical protein